MQAFEKASGKKVAVKLVDRRPGDVEAVWAATNTAQQVSITSKIAHHSFVGELKWIGPLTDPVRECLDDPFKPATNPASPNGDSL